MSLPVRVGTLLVAFLAVVGGAIFVVIHYLLAGPPVIDFTTGVTPASGQHGQHRAAGRPAEHGRATKPDWVSYFIQDPEDQAVGAHHAVQGAGRGHDPHHRARLRRLHAAAQPVLGQGHRHDRRTSSTSTASRSRCSTPGGLLGRAHVLDPRHRPERADGLADDGDREQRLCGTSPCTSGPKATMKFSFHAPTTTGDLLLAVPDSLRRRLRDRLRRAHADHRVHDRKHGGGVLMAAETAARRPAAPRPTGRPSPTTACGSSCSGWSSPWSPTC